MQRSFRHLFLLSCVIAIFPFVAHSETVIDLDDQISSKCTYFTNQVSDAQINAIRPMFAARSHRLWHLFFHGLRSSWGAFTQAQRDLLISIHPTLKVVRPYSLMDSSNFASEDFIYMHRVMIRMVREKLVAAGLPCIAGFNSVPTPTDSSWPVPPLWVGADALTAFSKSLLGYNTMVNLDQNQFQNDSWLRQQSASSVAGQLEGMMHMLFHHRFAAKSGLPERPFLSIYSEPSAEYTAPTYSFLLDTFSSTLPKAFWKLHGYIENTSLRWLALKGYRSVSIQCNGRPGCYQWNNTWMGPVPDQVCTCENHEHHEGETEHAEDHEHETDILKIITEFAKNNPSHAAEIESMLQTIDKKSAPGDN